MRQLWLRKAGEVMPEIIPSNLSQQGFSEGLKEARTFLLGWDGVTNSKASQACSGAGLGVSAGLEE